MDIEALHEGNREAWNRTARGGYAGGIEEDVERLRAGGTNLMEPELRILHDLREWCDRAIHLQCSHGSDALSLWKLGAKEVVGVDISEEMIAAAQRKSELLGAPARWIRSDVLQTPHELDCTADLVHTGRGAICWMMDLDAWSNVVFRLLKPGGKLLLFEGHPLDFAWDTEASTLRLAEGTSYFVPRPGPERGFPYNAALRVEPDRPVQLTSRIWTMGEIVTSVIRAGLRIELLEEYPEPFWNQFPNIPEAELRRMPHTFALVAFRDT
ncbi:class I SAM-dependent methyltransferase [Fimbriimonas ginsengisoli]|uniref:Methyltransferase type 11 n=1 Tax=Fimbriimonas ginsengisoli Gsoil 348 TaxID=661478 RepID=A0A068NRG4_FIMGI|nr:class I SAM-dependent methyltransferase [Fimbriimonas ginsengisoli]AIE86108.1 methyltransferase type 11 [Fimbriimonas ginsengisoli Gsoil 348]